MSFGQFASELGTDVFAPWAQATGVGRDVKHYIGDALNKGNAAMNNPWGQIMNPGKTVKNEANAVGNFVQDPTDIGNIYDFMGNSTPFMPNAVAKAEVGAAGKVKNMQQARANFDPYAGMPPQGGVIAAANDNRVSPWSFLKEGQ